MNIVFLERDSMKSLQIWPMVKVLVVKRDKLGDLLLTTPLIEVLAEKLPELQIDIWAPSFAAFVVENHPSVHRVWPMQKALDKSPMGLVQLVSSFVQIWKIRRQRYDWVICASGEVSTRAIRRSRLAGGAHLISFVPYDAKRIKKAYLGVTHGVSLLSGDSHESIRLAKLAEPILDEPLSSGLVRSPALHLSPQVREMGTAYLRRVGLEANRFVVVGLGARKEKRRPTVEQVLMWGAYFAAYGYRTVLSYTPGTAADPGYPSDEAVATEIINQDVNILPLSGSVQEAAAVISLASFSVIPDSGLMHIAAASPGGVIGLFADPNNSPSPNQWGPRGVRFKTIVAPRAISEVPPEIFINAFKEIIFEGWQA